jgi:hypothetical protein
MDREASTLPENEELGGIHGWLILPAIGTFLAPLVLFSSLFNSFSLMSQTHGRLADIAIFDAAFSSILFITSLRMLYLLITKNKTYPMIFCLFLGLNIASVIGDILVLNFHGFSADSLDKNLFRSIVPAAIWIPYMLRSKRVKRTFVISE